MKSNSVKLLRRRRQSVSKFSGGDVSQVLVGSQVYHSRASEQSLIVPKLSFFFHYYGTEPRTSHMSAKDLNHSGIDFILILYGARYIFASSSWRGIQSGFQSGFRVSRRTVLKIVFFVGEMVKWFSWYSFLHLLTYLSYLSYIHIHTYLSYNHLHTYTFPTFTYILLSFLQALTHFRDSDYRIWEVFKRIIGTSGINAVLIPEVPIISS